MVLHQLNNTVFIFGNLKELQLGLGLRKPISDQLDDLVKLLRLRVNRTKPGKVSDYSKPDIIQSRLTVESLRSNPHVGQLTNLSDSCSRV